MSVSIKNKVIFVIIIIMLLASGLFYFWRVYTKQTAPKQTSENLFDSFPFGGGSGNDAQPASSTPNDNSQSSVESEVDMPTLRQISNTPIAGGISFKDNDLTVVRYVDRGTGHIYETNEKSYDKIKLSNTTIPKVYQAIWSPNGQSVIMRYIGENFDDISSFSANIAKSTTSQDITKNNKSAFLPLNITQLSINPSGDKLFYLTNDIDGSVGIESNIDGSQKKKIFQSPAREWLVSWINKETIALATKPSSNVPGYLFFLNNKNGTENKIMSETNGLTALISSSTKHLLFSESDSSSVVLKYKNLKNNEDVEMSFKTLPEKCAWSRNENLVVYCAVPKSIKNGEYPDVWYQGLSSFTDSVWKVNIETKSSELIMDIQKETGNEIDIMEPFLSDGDEYLFFINKKDLSFWSLNLAKQIINKNSLNDTGF